MSQQVQIDYYQGNRHRWSVEFCSGKILREMWEEARYTLPGSDQTQQHRWGSGSPYCA